MSLSETLSERAKRYGSYGDLAELCQGVKSLMRGHPSWEDIPAYKKEALEMIAHKMARIVNGDYDYEDNWHDIAGYAKLGEPSSQKAPLSDCV